MRFSPYLADRHVCVAFMLFLLGTEKVTGRMATLKPKIHHKLLFEATKAKQNLKENLNKRRIIKGRHALDQNTKALFPRWLVGWRQARVR